MARTDQQFPLRLPPELKEKLENACKESGRSKNAEAVYRLEQSFSEEQIRNEGLNTISDMFNKLIEENQELKKQNELYNAKMLKLLDSLVDDLKKTK